MFRRQHIGLDEIHYGRWKILPNASGNGAWMNYRYRKNKKDIDAILNFAEVELLIIIHKLKKGDITYKALKQLDI